MRRRRDQPPTPRPANSAAHPDRAQTVMSTNVIRTDRWDRGVAGPRSVATLLQAVGAHHRARRPASRHARRSRWQVVTPERPSSSGRQTVIGPCDVAGSPPRVGVEPLSASESKPSRVSPGGRVGRHSGTGRCGRPSLPRPSRPGGDRAPLHSSTATPGRRDQRPVTAVDDRRTSEGTRRRPPSARVGCCATTARGRPASPRRGPRAVLAPLVSSQPSACQTIRHRGALSAGSHRCLRPRRMTPITGQPRTTRCHVGGGDFDGAAHQHIESR